MGLRRAGLATLYSPIDTYGRPAAPAALSKWASSPLFLRELLNLSATHEQVRSDDPADIQAEVEQRLAGLEPAVEVPAVERAGGGRSPALRIFLDRDGGVDLEL